MINGHFFRNRFIGGSYGLFFRRPKGYVRGYTPQKMFLYGPEIAIDGEVSE